MTDPAATDAPAPPAASLPAPSGADRSAPAFEEDTARRGAGDCGGAAPMLYLAAFEGRLDWLLELARARKVDLARLSLVELAEQLLTALGEDADDGPGGTVASLPRRGEWVVMGAALAELRSRLLLPGDGPGGQQAREEARALRERLSERERMLTAAKWLDRRAQLGRDVFARGAPTLGATRQRTADPTALLRACLAVLQAEVAKGERYGPRPPAIWPVRQALARARAMLPRLRDAAPDGGGASLWRFLPDAECLASAGLAPDAVPDPALLRTSAVASTLVAVLELAREGQITLTQERNFGDILACSASATTGRALNSPHDHN